MSIKNGLIKVMWPCVLGLDTQDSWLKDAGSKGGSNKLLICKQDFIKSLEIKFLGVVVFC